PSIFIIGTLKEFCILFSLAVSVVNSSYDTKKSVITISRSRALPSIDSRQNFCRRSIDESAYTLIHHYPDDSVNPAFRSLNARFCSEATDMAGTKNRTGLDLPATLPCGRWDHCRD